MSGGTVRVLWGIVAGLCCCSLTGCAEVLVYGAYHGVQGQLQKVPKRSELWGGYRKGAVYEIQQPVFLADGTNFTWSPALVSGEGMTREKKRGEWDGPPTVEAYRCNPAQWPKVWGVVETGTRLRCTKLRHKQAEYYELKYLAVYAKLLDGPYKGKNVEITELSSFLEKGSWIVRPDPYLLKPVENAGPSRQEAEADR